MSLRDYTPQQIEEILEAFFDVAGTRQYIGARYVPIFGRGEGTSVDWDGGEDAYEPLSIVYWRGDTYTSRRYVPAGIDIENDEYWVVTGRYNAQVEQYRQEVLSFQGQIDAIRNDYVPFPDGIYHPKYGTAGQVLATLADGTTEWQDPVVPSDAQAEAVITDWLDDHPEATTTVQDGTVTTSKLADGAVTDAKLATNGVKLMASKLKDAMCASEYDATVDYKMGDFVWHNSVLFSAKFDIAAETWTSGHWNITPVADAINFAIRQVCEPYDPTKIYHSGDYCRWHNNTIRRCVATTANESTPTSTKWANVTLNVMNELVSQIKNPLSNAVLQMGYALPTLFVNGAISSSGDDINTYSYRIRSIPLTFEHEMTIQMEDGFMCYVWAYPEGESPYSILIASSGGAIPPSIPVRICIRRAIEDTAETADINLFASKAIMERLDASEATITAKGADLKLKRLKNVEYVDLLENAQVLLFTSRNTGFSYDVHLANTIRSVKIATNLTDTYTEIRFSYANGFTLASTQEIELVLYIPDATQITMLSLRMSEAGYTKNYDGELHDGWNVIRFQTLDAGDNVDFTASISLVRLLMYHSAGTDTILYVGSLTQIKPAYANVIVIGDGPYYTFYDLAYPALKNINVPISWAVDGGILDNVTETDRHLINEDELELLAYDGISEFSFHSYDGVPTATVTAEEALADTLKCQRFLKQHGLEPQRPWRAAWLQNRCANHELADLEVEASASYDNTPGIALYPFVDPYNIPRVAIQGRTEEFFDGIFSTLKNTHTTVLFYTHGVSSAERDISTTMLSYFVSKLSTGISEGWLNPTTYNRLVSLYEEI